jgi:hypothetical protein
MYPATSLPRLSPPDHNGSSNLFLFVKAKFLVTFLSVHNIIYARMNSIMVENGVPFFHLSTVQGPYNQEY